MTKSKQVVKKSEQTSAMAAMPDDLMDEIMSTKGLGYSEDANDSMVPVLAILQDNSGEVKKRHSRHIEGAEAGDFIIRSLGKVFSMSENSPPLVFQPCGFIHVWVEWQGDPGEGAPVARYPFADMPEEAEEKEDPENPDRLIWTMPNGNRLQDTREHYGNLVSDDGVAMPIVVPMGGSNHTVSRGWTLRMKQFVIPGSNGAKARSFMRIWGLRPKFNQKGEQSWYKYEVGDLGWVTDPDLMQAGLGLYRAVEEEGRVVAETEAPTEKEKEDAPI